MSFDKVLHLIEVTQTSGSGVNRELVTSEDLLPVPAEQRTWDGFNYVAFWIADCINLNTWMIASGMIQSGMSWWQAWLSVCLGYGIVAPFIVLNARPGAVFHITFPAVSRTSFGIFGSLWCVFNRAAMACIFYGVQASIGGTCVLVMLRAMWPSVNNIPNSIPASSGTTTRDFLCFFLFWLISLPLIWLPIHKIRYFFTVTSILAPTADIAFLVWCIVKANGVGPIIQQKGTLQGSKLAWAMVAGAMSCISNKVTLVTNAPDFASRAKRPSAAVYPQLITMPLTYALLSLMGVIVSSSSQLIYGEAVWSPVTLLGMFLDDDPSPATRFGVWFISLAFICAQLGTNISANSVSAGCDLTALLPRFVNIRRGGYIAAIIGLCMCPWNLTKSNNSFTSYLSGYSVFLSSIAGVMATEYWVIRKGHYRVGDLYTTQRDGWYWYTYGINFRAYAAYIAGIMINVVGFVGDTGRKVPIAATHIFDLSFFTGFGTSALVYFVLNWLFPTRGKADTFEEVDESDPIDEVDNDLGKSDNSETS
ncbi:hypothetical protein HYDPIDRAFT_176834 [Hydnomerulius pinastri MD-312]|uniref:Uracil permease n=1 Tax=Hydnomerulius pinastri MD-312 TaxID=994086 RepID=A0A0C9VUV6_9AGAM|nr:hypothetical protein HYDPIDRAFT_176834 [Hydnomerulius pinastri MD-312]